MLISMCEWLHCALKLNGQKFAAVWLVFYSNEMNLEEIWLAVPVTYKAFVGCMPGCRALNNEIITFWWRFSFLLSELEMDTENVVEMEGQQTILKNSGSHEKIDRYVES